MKKVGAFEAKTHLSQLLEQVAGGEEIVITRHGHPIAKLVPADGVSPQRVSETVERMKQARRGRKADNIREMIEEGRRF